MPLKSLGLGMAGVLLAGSLATSAIAEDTHQTQKGGVLHRASFVEPASISQGETAAVAAKPAKAASASRQASPRVRANKKSRRVRKRASGNRLPRHLVHKREEAVTKKPAGTAGVKVASLQPASAPAKSKPRIKQSVTGGSARVQWVASSRCLAGRLKAAIHYVARNFGRVRVNSTCRSRSRNRRVGGARRSWHLGGRAADIRVFGNVRAAARYLRRIAGGYKHYGGGLFHIDTGPRRNW